MEVPYSDSLNQIPKEIIIKINVFFPMLMQSLVYTHPFFKQKWNHATHTVSEPDYFHLTICQTFLSSVYK